MTHLEKEAQLTKILYLTEYKEILASDLNSSLTELERESLAVFNQKLIEYNSPFIEFDLLGILLSTNLVETVQGPSAVDIYKGNYSLEVQSNLAIKPHDELVLALINKNSKSYLNMEYLWSID